MGTLFVQLKNTLEFHMKTVDVSNEGSNDGVTRDALKKFIKTSVKSGVKLEDLKDCLLQLHDVELLVNEQEYRYVLNEFITHAALTFCFSIILKVGHQIH